MKTWKPKFIENSKIPVWLSYISPINISAVTLGPVVISRGQMSETIKRHETIHFQQYLETLFIGFLILYPLYWVINVCRGQSGSDAYYNIPFEIEAYANQDSTDYLLNRKRYTWIKMK